MAKIIFYPLGNADCCLLRTDTQKLFLFDYADVKDRNDPRDKRIALKEAVRHDIGWPTRLVIDVLAITHAHRDHLRGFQDLFFLEHSRRYQDPLRIKARELWVPAVLVTEPQEDDDAQVLRAEAYHRLSQRRGIRIFGRSVRLAHWFRNNGLWADYNQFTLEAGQTVPGFHPALDGVGFFVHAPLADEPLGRVVDPNEHCLVLQAVLRSGDQDSRFLITSDSVRQTWERIVRAPWTRQDPHLLDWDVFRVPHHCSYLSMAKEKGVFLTEAVPEFDFVLARGNRGAVMVSSSECIPSQTQEQPPHVQTWMRYRLTEQSLGANLINTMDHPHANWPGRLTLDVDARGVRLSPSDLMPNALVDLLTRGR